ncbi:MAG: MazG family protein [Syntrophobacter sp.]
MIQEDNGRWNKVRDIWEIISRLRGENGCPWDRKQSPQSVQTYLVEEAHEAAAAVRSGNVRDAAEELGDVLFMVLFLAYLYEQRGDFSLEHVCDNISEKMIRRHPHVFGEVSVNSAEEVKDNWEKIKKEEKDRSGQEPDPVPETLPALIRAYRIVSRLAQHGDKDWDDMDARMRAYSLQNGVLADALSSGNRVSMEVIGDILLQLVAIARIQGFRPEDCLHEALRNLKQG